MAYNLNTNDDPLNFQDKVSLRAFNPRAKFQSRDSGLKNIDPGTSPGIGNV